MSKNKKLILAAVLAALCLGAGILLLTTGLGQGTSVAKADSEACVHDFSIVEVVEPGCVTSGYTLTTCSKCGETQTSDFVSPAGHNWDDDENVITVEPTCTSMGFRYHVCTNCWSWYQSDWEDALGHDLSETAMGATCTAYGYTVHSCLRDGCGYSYRDSYTDPLGHSLETEAKEATCTEDGYVYEWCVRCDYADEVSHTDRLGHSYEANATAPSCTAYGYTTYTCVRDGCGDMYVDGYVSPTGHTYTIEQIPMSEGSYGYTKLTCTVCSYVYVTNIVTSGENYIHNYKEVVHSPTCETEGYTEFVCTDEGCGESIVCNQVLATGHDWESKYVEPTCTDAGGWANVCARCGACEIIEPVNALGHSFKDTVFAPTCTDVGYTVHTCSACGFSYTDSYVSEMGHIFVVSDASVSMIQKTLTLSYKCVSCGSSAISRLYVTFTDAKGNVYTYDFSQQGVADFSSLPDGNYTARVTDSVLGETVSMFTLEGSNVSDSGTDEGVGADDGDGAGNEKDRESSSGGEENHTLTPTLSVNTGTKTITTSLTCSCGEDLTDDVCVVFSGELTYIFSPVNGKVDYSDVPAGDYTVSMVYDGQTLRSFTLTIQGGAASGSVYGDDADSASGTDADTDEGLADGGQTESDGKSDAETPGASDGQDTDYGEDDTYYADEDVEGGSGCSNATLIVLIVVFVVVIGVLVALFVVWRRRRRRSGGGE